MPRWAPDHQRSVPVNARVEPDLLARVDEAAAAAGQNRSEWVRDAITEKLDWPPRIDVRQLKEFIRRFARASELLVDIGNRLGSDAPAADALLRPPGWRPRRRRTDVTATHPDGES